jgi:hypothetical protein
MSGLFDVSKEIIRVTRRLAGAAPEIRAMVDGGFLLMRRRHVCSSS